MGIANKFTNFCIILVTCIFADANAEILHVNASAAANGNGRSWSTAYKYLQDALYHSLDGDELWIASGSYYPDQGGNETKNDRAASFVIKQNVKLYGGFSGVEESRFERDAAENLTILSGEISTDPSGWSIHVLSLLGNATIDSLIIEKGNANGGETPTNRGGGIYSPNRSYLSIINCKITNNMASCSGGGIFFGTQTSSRIFARDCEFMDNIADNNTSDSFSGGGQFTHIAQ